MSSMCRLSGQVFLTAAVILATSAAQGDDQKRVNCADLFAKIARIDRQVGLSKTQLRKAEDERVCILSFPWIGSVDREKDDLWNQPSTVLAETRTALKKLEDDYQKFAADNAALMDRLGRLSYSNRAAVLHGSRFKITDNQKVRYFTFRLGGGSTDQQNLYCDMLFVKALCKEQKFAEAASYVTEIRKHAGLQVTSRGFDDAEKHSYLSRETLQNLIVGFDYLARLKTVSQSIAERLALLASYLDDRDSLEMTMALDIAAGNLDDGMLELVPKSGPIVDPESPTIMSELLALPNMAGVSRDQDGVTYYIQGKGLRAIRQDNTGVPQLLSAEVAGERMREYCRKTIAQRSTPTMTLFGVHRFDGFHEIDLPGRTIKLSDAEVVKLAAGEPLPKEHELTKLLQESKGKSLVAFSDPLMLRPGEPLRDSDALTFALRKAYPESDIVRDPLSARTERLAEDLRSMRVPNPADVVPVVADRSLARIRDANVINNLCGPEGTFAKAGIKVVNFNGPSDSPWKGPSGKTVIVITGHSDEELKRFVKELGQAGYLTDNVVIFNSCEAELTRELIAEINGRYKARGTFAYQGKILAREVATLLESFVSELKSSRDKGQSLSELLWRTVRRIKLNGVWTICRRCRVAGLSLNG